MNAFEEVLFKLSECAKTGINPETGEKLEVYPTYLNEEDGLRYCSNCHTARQTRVNFPAPDTIVWGDCKCMTEHYNAIREQGKLQEEYERLCRMKHDAFPETYAEARNWTFDTDDHQGDEKSMQIIRNYADNFRKFYDKGAGLLLYGDVGVGKSFAAACVINELLDRGISCLMTDFSTIINELTGEQMPADSKTQAVLDKYNTLADTVQANQKLALAKVLDAKAYVVVNSADYSELSGDGEKLAEAFQQHGCEIKQAPLHALGFNGKPAGYMIIFCICAVAYLIGWFIMKTLVPKYKPIVVED